MNKGLSELLVVVFLMLIGISLTAVAYFWSQGVVFNVYPNETQDNAYMRQRACLNIQDINDTHITINNCGSVPLDRFYLYINDAKEDITIPKLNPSERYEIPISESGTATVYVTSNYAESPIVTYDFHEVLTFCGDDTCNGDEKCYTCGADCGACTDWASRTQGAVVSSVSGALECTTWPPTCYDTGDCSVDDVLRLNPPACGCEVFTNTATNTPGTVTVDLGTIRSISKIDLYLQYMVGCSLIYSYAIDLSVDGNSWNRVVDQFSSAVFVSSMSNYPVVNIFATKSARYINIVVQRAAIGGACTSGWVQAKLEEINAYT
ncbi:MAG: discoidin domain-containing protein [Nanoarchaeota archaeon]|nr:discoidin domain-containing protein [Nanoarchaeota archaeon]MBU4124272.1 discoidin domain-containing protein [Nanoarchaeota archaeon]